jgi:uracil-DNA glycosylase family 4
MPTYIWGRGPAPAELMVVGDTPGFAEHDDGYPFAGKSGDELTRFLDGFRLPERADTYLTYIYKQFRPGEKQDPTPEELAAHRPLFEDEVREVRPRIIAAFGRLAGSELLGRPVDLDTEHGLAFRITVADHPCILYLAYHPASGFRSPTMMSRYVYDMHRLQMLYHGALPVWPGDAYPEPHYAELAAGEEVPTASVVATDTEGSVARPWCLSYSIAAGRGVVARPPQTDAVFVRWRARG